MQQDDITALVIASWVLFAILCSAFFLFLRIRLGKKNQLVRYPYGYFRQRKTQLVRRYFMTLGFSVLFAISATVVLTLANKP